MNNSELVTQSDKKWEQMDRDPVCGQIIKIEEAVGSTLFMANKYCFCCATCKNVFDNAPSVYADKGEVSFDPTNSNNSFEKEFIIF